MQLKIMSYRRLVLITTSIIFFTLSGCYFLSEIKKHHYMKIFPREAVTNSAKWYPQSILFKVGMGLTTSPMLLLVFILASWLNYWLEKTTLSCYKKFVRFMNFIVLTGILGQNLTVFSIDRNGTWIEHGYSAWHFYRVIFPYLGLYVWIVSRIRKVYPECMGDFSYAYKVAMIWFLILMSLLMVISAIWLEANVKQVIYTVQWAGLFLLCLFFISHVEDTPQIFIIFDQESMCLQLCLEEPQKPKIETEQQPLLNAISS